MAVKFKLTAIFNIGEYIFIQLFKIKNVISVKKMKNMPTNKGIYFRRKRALLNYLRYVPKIDWCRISPYLFYYRLQENMVMAGYSGS